MRISHRHKFIFFSNPKTGSESVRKLLDPYADIRGVPFWETSPAMPFYAHISPREVRDLFVQRGWDYDSYFKFTFIRNPWARLVSLYEMIYGAKKRKKGVVASVSGFLRNLRGHHPSPAGFRKWIKTVRPDGVGGGGPANQRWQRYGTYSILAYAGDDGGGMLVDKVIRLEDITNELIPLLERIGVPNAGSLAIPRVNVRKHSPYIAYYDDECADLVRRNYAYDIETFGYRFGS